MKPEERIQKEKDIKEYLKIKGISKVKYLQVEQTFNDLGVEVNVWNVKTNKGSWWIVEGETAPMNLYTQDEFYFSADEAYSFHMGIAERLGTRYKNEFKHILDEIPLDIDRVKSINRKLNLAADQLNHAIDSEHFQAIGLTCRECLIELGSELAKRNQGLVDKNNLKSGDFKGIANVFIDHYIPGESNSNLRNYARKVVDIGWKYSSEILHSTNKNRPDIKICILFTACIVSLFENLFLKFLGFDYEQICKQCKSKDHNLLDSENENQIIFHCNHCGFEEIIEVEPVEIKNDTKKTR